LKKRTKKLLSVAVAPDPPPVAPQRREMGKSFLLLFFKKEVLPS
jgi:hypothetical protein